VYKLRKVLYGLKQAPRAWYGRLRGFLFERGFEMGKVDQTLFLLRQGKDILIVQVYMDDIVFVGLSNSLIARFAEDMSREFEMSMMGELQFLLGLQIKQSKKGTFVHQAKYTKDIVRKFKMRMRKVNTWTRRSIEAYRVTPLLDDNEARHPVLGMSMRSFSSVSKDFASASGQSHIQVLASHSRLHGFSDADFDGCRLDRKSTSGTCQFLGSSLVS
jgi:hypothetical protein